MTRADSIIIFFKKTVFPILIALLLYTIMSNIFEKDGVKDWMMIWVGCGLPYGFRRMGLIIPTGSQAGVMFLVSLFFGGLFGGFVLIWKLIVAVYYIPVTIYRLIFWR